MTNSTKTKMTSSRAAEFIIKINNYQNQIWSGMVEFNPTGETIEFTGLMNLLESIQFKLDEYGFPQASMALRKWDMEEANPETEVSPGDENKEAIGKENLSPYNKPLSSFMLRIQFRQNACWQGNLIWIEGRRSVAFRSVLEMASLLEAAVQSAAHQTRAAPVHRPVYRWQPRQSVS